MLDFNSAGLLFNSKAPDLTVDDIVAAGMSLEEVQDLFHAKFGDNTLATPRQDASVEAA